jgi:hypothetical protein
MQTIIISTIIALALWAIIAKLYKFTHKQIDTLLENKAERKRQELRIEAKKKKAERIEFISNRTCRENDYLTKLVYYFRALPLQKSKNKDSPTWFLTVYLRGQIEKQVKRTMDPTDYVFYGEVVNHLIGKTK